MEGFKDITFEKLQEEDIPSFVEIIAKGFFNYVYFTPYFPKPTTREKFLYNIIETDVKVNFNSAEYFIVRSNGTVIGATKLCSAEYKKPNLFKYLTKGLLKAFFVGGVINSFAWAKMENKACKTSMEFIKKNTDKKVWYIDMLAVDKSLKRKNLGSYILNELLIQYSKEHGGDYLSVFTNSQKNRQFYTKNGFTQFGETFFKYKGKVIGSWNFYKDIKK